MAVSELQRKTSLTESPLTPAMRALVEQVRAIVRAEADAEKAGHAVAHLLKPYLGSDELLTSEQMAPCTDCYRQHILHVEPDGSFSIVSLVWLPGQETAIHDHVSWCVVGVHRGQERETVYARAGGDSDPHLVLMGNSVNPSGSVAALVPPGDIHQVENGGGGLAVSLHIYGANIHELGSSIRRRYDLEVREPAGV